MKGKHLSYHIDSHTNEKMPLVNIAEELATNILPASLLVVEDTRRGGLYEWFKREGKNHSQNPYNPKLREKMLTRMMIPNPREGRSKLTQDSIWVTCTLKRGEMTPVLFRRPLSCTTIFPERWSSISSNSPM